MRYLRSFILAAILFSLGVYEAPSYFVSQDESWLLANRDYFKKIISILSQGETVVMAVAGQEFICTNRAVPDPVQRADFLKKYEKDLVDNYMADLVLLGNEVSTELSKIDLSKSENKKILPSLVVVDREAVSRILEELNFQQTGYVTREMSDQLGKLLGVTHLLMVSASRDIEPGKPAGYASTDAVSIKLVDIKSGAILTMEKAFNHIIDGQYTVWSKRVIYSKNKQDFQFMGEVKEKKRSR